ncbi:hypothetical protein SAMN06298216_2273 [Spirosomataceae bacterium TFI 002]|nr:hypothetical protein SAMN06298216_2273 [Spirosomataceae bacterium TFI 002]
MRLSLEIYKTPGFKVIILYFFITYVPSFLFSFIFIEAFRDHFWGFIPFSSWAFIMLSTAIFIIVIVLDNLFSTKHTKSSILSFLCPYQYNFLNYFLSIVFFYLSLDFYNNYGLSFYQSGTSMSEFGGSVFVFITLKTYFRLFVFYEYLRLLKEKNTFKKKHILYLITTFSFVITIAASMDLIFAVIAIALLFIKKEAILIKSRNLKIFSLKGLGIVLLLFFISMGVIFIGFANKFGFEQTQYLFLSDEVREEIIRQIVIRLANSYASLIQVANNHPFDINFQIDAIKIPFDVLKYRFSILFGIESPKPEIFNISRLNFLNTYQNYHARAGASPGLVASFLYVPFFPLNLFLLSSYLVLIIRAINRVIQNSINKVSILGLLIIFLYVLPLFESPIDFLIIFDPTTIYLILLITVFSKYSK